MSAVEDFGPVDPVEAAELKRRRQERRAQARRNAHYPPWADGEVLDIDNARLQASERAIQAAGAAGERGDRFDKRDCPRELRGQAREAHRLGLQIHRRNRRRARLVKVWGWLCWCARTVAPAQAKRFRRWRKRHPALFNLRGEWQLGDLVTPVLAGLVVLAVVLAIVS